MLILRRTLLICITTIFTQSALCNPIFGDKDYQFMINAGHSFIFSLKKFKYRRMEPKLKYAYLNLSRPNTLFGINTRDSLEVGHMFGISKYTQAIAGVSKELVLGSDKLYFTLGLGVYLKGKKTDRGSSHFTFGERLGIGRRFGDKNLEFFIRHFSNAGLASKNKGQNFLGLALGFNF